MPPIEFFQEEYIEKYPRDSDITLSLYELNRLILTHAGHSVSKVYGREEKIPLGEEELIIDCQVLNLSHHYKNIPTRNKRIVIDYSNLGHRIVNFSDAYPINHFIRSLFKIYRFNRKHHISELWSTKSSWERDLLPISEWYWRNKFLNIEKISEHAKSFLNEHANLFQELQSAHLDKKTLFICPHTQSNIAQLSNDLQELIFKDESAAEIFFDAEAIFVKQHRISSDIYPNNFEILGRRITVLNEPMTRLLPTEILLHGIQNSYLFSTISSILFTSDPIRTWSLGKISAKDRKDYGLMLARANRAELGYSFNTE